MSDCGVKDRRLVRSECWRYFYRCERACAPTDNAPTQPADFVRDNLLETQQRAASVRLAAAQSLWRRGGPHFQANSEAPARAPQVPQRGAPLRSQPWPMITNLRFHPHEGDRLGRI